jgi:hypothetical protein
MQLHVLISITPQVIVPTDVQCCVRILTLHSCNEVHTTYLFVKLSWSSLLAERVTELSPSSGCGEHSIVPTGVCIILNKNNVFQSL